MKIKNRIHKKIDIPNFLFGYSDEEVIETFAVVTGASSGIGHAIAEELAKKGVNLILVALPNSGLETVSKTLADKYTIIVHSFCLDLTDESAPLTLFEECKSKDIHISILVNNAGFGNLELFENSDLSELMQMMTLNNRAVVSLTYLFIPLLKKSEEAYILNLGSLASFFKIPYKAVYSATKSFIYSFSVALGSELKSSNIFVSCLCPGSTLTSPRVQDILRRTGCKNMTLVQTPQAVAKTAVKKLFKGQLRIVPGFHNRILLGVSQLLPEIVIDRLLLNIFKPKISVGAKIVFVRKRNYGLLHALNLANL